MKKKHSKYLNTGIVFEMLSRKLTSEILSGESRRSLIIVNKFFKKGTEIAKELNLYRVVELQEKDKSLVPEIIDRSIKIRNTINLDKLSREKKILLKTISENYDISSFFSQKIPISKYRRYADLYMIFENSNSPVEYVRRKNRIMESYKSSRKEENERAEEIKSLLGEDKDISKLSLRILLDRFNSKYSSLGEKQKTLLSKYINGDPTAPEFLDFMVKESISLKESLSRKKISDKTLKIKINECINLLDSIIISTKTKDEHVSSLLKFYELEELL